MAFGKEGKKSPMVGITRSEFERDLNKKTREEIIEQKIWERINPHLKNNKQDLFVYDESYPIKKSLFFHQIFYIEDSINNELGTVWDDLRNSLSASLLDINNLHSLHESSRNNLIAKYEQFNNSIFLPFERTLIKYVFNYANSIGVIKRLSEINEDKISANIIDDVFQKGGFEIQDIINEMDYYIYVFMFAIDIEEYIDDTEIFNKNFKNELSKYISKRNNFLSEIKSVYIYYLMSQIMLDIKLCDNTIQTWRNSQGAAKQLKNGRGRQDWVDKKNNAKPENFVKDVEKFIRDNEYLKKFNKLGKLNEIAKKLNIDRSGQTLERWLKKDGAHKLIEELNN